MPCWLTGSITVAPVPEPLLLDLYCGLGGASRGYERAGFRVVGVDIEPQPDYGPRFEFVQADAIESLSRLLDGGRVGGHALSEFDAIHASPPCQRYTAMGRMANTRDDNPDLVEPTRALLRAWGGPYVIENVEGAPLRDPLVLMCGTMFGLGCEANGRWYELQRHRLFESNVNLDMTWLSCKHGKPRPWFVDGVQRTIEVSGVVGVYGDHLRNRSRGGAHRDRGVDFQGVDRKQKAREALDIPWAQRWHGLSEAIPPVYTQTIGQRLIMCLERR